jgi:hypothetical protein
MNFFHPIPRAQAEIAGIEESLADIKSGRIYSEDEIWKEFDL